MFGVGLQKAPQDWQILQQQAGAAVVELAGTWQLPEETDIKEPLVYVRVVEEDTGREVINWTQAEMGQEEPCWKCELSVPTGGLYRLETCLADRNQAALEWALRGDMRHHLGVGDLFVIAGQSNSAGYGKDPFYDPPQLGVHLLRNSMRWDLASHPMNESTDTRHPANLEMANPGNSPYLSFGKTLMRILGYPIGLLQTSLGGSPLSQWEPAENGHLYASMMEVIRSQGGKIKGVLWYQGCSDIDPEPSRTYEKRFTAMLQTFREEMGEEVPWITVQLNRRLNDAEKMPESDDGWGRIREAQRQCARKLPGVSVVPATDFGLSDGIHNSASANVVLGERMAEAALEDLYHRRNDSHAPDLERAAMIASDMLELRFSHVRGRLFLYDSWDICHKAFTIEDENGVAEIESAEAQGDVIRIRVKRSLCGKVWVSGGWQMNPPSLMPVDFSNHLPVLSFYRVKVS